MTRDSLPDQSAMPERMRAAVALLGDSDEPWAAVTLTQPSRRIQPFGRGPKSAFINLRTARALEARGLVHFLGGGTEPLYEYVALTDAGQTIALDQNQLSTED